MPAKLLLLIVGLPAFLLVKFFYPKAKDKMDIPPFNTDRRESRSIQEWATIAALVINLIGIIWVTAQQNSKNEIILTEVQSFQEHQATIFNALVDKVNTNTINIAVLNSRVAK